MSKRYAGGVLERGVTAHWDVMSGAPVIAGTRISTEWVASRFLAGRSVRGLAADYQLVEDAIECALRYEFRRRKDRRPAFRAEREKAKA